MRFFFPNWGLIGIRCPSTELYITRWVAAGGLNTRFLSSRVNIHILLCDTLIHIVRGIVLLLSSSHTNPSLIITRTQKWEQDPLHSLFFLHIQIYYDQEILFQQLHSHTPIKTSLPRSSPLSFKTSTAHFFMISMNKIKKRKNDKPDRWPDHATKQEKKTTRTSSQSSNRKSRSPHVASP